MFPIITLTSLLQFCGPTASKSMTSSGYEEDLSVYREQYEYVAPDKEVKEETQGENEEIIDVEPRYSIEEGLDSVRSLILQSREKVRYVDGFTIQLYSGNSRDKANEIRQESFELLETFTPTISYEQPNYKVKVGTYYSKLEANGDFNILKSTFSRALLVPSKIKIEEE